MENWIEIAHVTSPLEAHMIKGRLEAEGVPCFLQGETLASVVGTVGAYTSSPQNPLGGVTVLVQRDEAERARRLLGEDVAE